MSLLPWPRLMATALQLGITPQAFWSLSVSEWRAAHNEHTVLSRDDLDRLSAAFPDEEPRIHDINE